MTQYREWKIKVDWTRDIAARVDMPQFVQGDTKAVRLSIEMVNDRAIVDITPTYRLMVLIVRPDGQALLEEADIIDGNSAEYIFPGNALEVVGKARVHLGLFGTSGERLTHEKALDFWVGDDPGFCEDDAIIATTEYGVLSQLIAEVEEIQLNSKLEYFWDGDKLGIKRPDEVDYTFSPHLTGPMPILEWSEIANKPPLLENFDQHTLTYLHRQNEDSDVWTAPHNLDKMYVHATCYDSFGEEVVGSIKVIDNNTVEIRFSKPIRGKAYIN